MARPRELEAGVQVRLKVDGPLLERVDAYAARRCASEKHPRGNRSLALRELLQRGLTVPETVLRFAESLSPDYTSRDVEKAAAALRERLGHRPLATFERMELGWEATPDREQAGPVLVLVATEGSAEPGGA